MAPQRQALPRPTLRDVAARAEVSASTASLAFADDPRVAPATRARVLAAALELGYPGPDPLARSLRQGRSGVVGAVVGERLRYSFADPHAVTVLDGLAAELDELGSSLLLLGGGVDDGRRLARFSQVALDAAVYVTCGAPIDPALDVLLRRGVPVVAIEGPHAPGVHLVDIDDLGASADLAQLVRELGHERIAVVTLPWVLQNRLRGVESVVGPLPPHRVWQAASNQRQEGERAARALLAGEGGRPLPAGERPSAVIAQSDLLAVGVVTGATALGLRVPDDVSVAGFDGIETPWLGSMVLTTIVQPAEEKGRAAGRAVAELLAGRTPADVMLPVTLRSGTTTAAAPRGA